VFFPRYDLLFEFEAGGEFVDMKWTPAGAPHRRIERSFRREGHDKIAQVFWGSFIYRTYEGYRLVLEEREGLKMSYYAPQQLFALLRWAGLEVIERYGGWDRRPLDDKSKEIILV
jgi:hypothetical protein